MNEFQRQLSMIDKQNEHSSISFDISSTIQKRIGLKFIKNYFHNCTILDCIFLLLIFILLVTNFLLVQKININWDEFNYLSSIYNYQSGRPIPTIQSFHVHFFGWLKNIDGNEIDQIIAARYIFLLIYFCSLGIIYKLSRMYFKRTEALFTVFLVLCCTDLIRHAFSFRPDLLCLFLFLTTIMLLMNERVYTTLLSGLIISICFLISIKTVFYFITIISFLVINSYMLCKRKNVLRHIFSFVFSTLCCLFVLYAFHSEMITHTSNNFAEAIISGYNRIAEAGCKVLWTGSIFPRKTYLYRSFIENFASWYVIIVGIYLAAKNIYFSIFEKSSAFILILTMPLFTLVFYRNAFPYYFVFIFPLALFTSNIYLKNLLLKTKDRKNNIAAILIIFPIIFGAFNAGKTIYGKLEDQTTAQRELLDLIHSIFPKPVPYIDRNRMVSSFPNVGFWMSTWGLENYRNVGIPVMESIVNEHQPLFIIANSSVLRINDENWFGQEKSIYRLFDEDYRFLQDNYIHHWSLLYLPGKYFENLGKVSQQDFDIFIEGDYTVEGDGALKIDGKKFFPGDILNLTKGQHHIENIDTFSATLRWGANLLMPNKNPSEKPFYTGL